MTPSPRPPGRLPPRCPPRPPGGPTAGLRQAWQGVGCGAGLPGGAARQLDPLRVPAFGGQAGGAAGPLTSPPHALQARVPWSDRALAGHQVKISIVSKTYFG